MDPEVEQKDETKMEIREASEPSEPSEPTEPSNEGNSPSSTAASQKMTLQKAIELGEYKPEFLAQFPEWHTYTRHVQFQFIRKALENRNKQLVVQWAEITNVIDFRLKPHLREALTNIEKQLQKLGEEKEKLYVEYSTE